MLVPGPIEFAVFGVIIVGFVLFVWALVSVLISDLEAAAKIVWAIVVLAFPVAGPIVWLVYRIIGRSR